MKKYYYNCLRGFSNEFSVISVNQNDAAEVKAFGEYQKRYNNSSNTDWDLHQITRKRAEEIIRLERATKRSYLSAGLNLSNNPVGATEITTATEYFELG